MITCSRPKFSDFYTQSQTELLKNPTLYSGTYLCRLYMEYPPPPGVAMYDYLFLAAYLLLPYENNNGRTPV